VSKQVTGVPVVGHDEPECNLSNNPAFSDLIEQRLGRRSFIAGGVSAALGTLMAGTAMAHGFSNQFGPQHGPQHGWHHRGPRRGISPGFTPVPHSSADTVIVPQGYSVQVMLPEGTPLTQNAAAYIPGDHNSGADREQQVGAHHDGMEYFPMHPGAGGNLHGLLCINFENINLELIHPNGFTIDSATGYRPVEDEVRKEIASHGVGVVEVGKFNGEWQVLKGRYNRRYTANSPMEICGPVRGSDFVKTKYSPTGTQTRGTLNNCGSGRTPWGTYITNEENWAGYFFNTGTRPREQSRYGVPTSARSTYGWGTRAEDQYARFNTTPTATDATGDYRNETNGQGWAVEIDPFAPNAMPKKRTALGRFAHEGAAFAPAKPGRPITVYMGDDSRGEYIYKYVSNKKYIPGRADGRLLDDGKLYVARFNADGSGYWILLEYGVNGLIDANGFTSQADVLVNTRSAADYVQATRMDRPEWTTVDYKTGYVYCTLTNNSNRGVSANQPVDAANPRVKNPDGHIIRWRETGDCHDATEFEWDVFVYGGPTLATVQALGTTDTVYQGNEQYAAQVFPGTDDRAYLADTATFNSPDGLWVAPTGILWIQTDGYSNASRGFGNQQMLAADPTSGDIRRFLTGPIGCELTGLTSTPDGKTLFVNIQHPEGQSTWPNINGETRPRSATLVITKDDGGIIGS
jgi:uncharacterized protein